MTGEDARTLRGVALAALLGLAGFALWSWPLARNLSTHTLVRAQALPRNAGEQAAQADWSLILANDQDVSVWGAIQNARALAGFEWKTLLWQGQCYPMPAAAALGEHLIEPGMLSTPWWVLSGDPIVAYNLMLLATFAIAATGMFLFVLGHTGSVPAAAAAAVAFAFATPRISDLPYHPAVVGVHWIPWVLWAFDRVMDAEGIQRVDAGRIWAVLLFGATLLLASLVGSYPLIAMALVGGAYGLTAVTIRALRGTLQRGVLVRCAIATLPALVAAGAVLVTYARVQREWALTPNPDAKYLVGALDYLPGGLMSAGCASVAGLLLLVVFRRGVGREAVLPLAAATLVAFVLTTRISFPGGGSWSLYETLAGVIGLLDSVRAPGKAGLAVCFGLQALGAIGWGRLLEKLRPVSAGAIAALLIAVTALETSPPAALRGMFGEGARMQLREIAPPRDRIVAFESSLGEGLDRRPVLDLPPGRMVKAPLALLDAAYHGHPTSACYASLVAPTMREAYAIGARGRSDRGVAELAAAGFGYIIERPSSSSIPLSPTDYPSPARLLVFEKDFAVWRLPHPGVIHRDVSQLDLAAKGGATRSAAFAPEPPHEIDIEVTNRGKEMWARPVQPLFADVELRSAAGEVAFRSRARGVLPLALSPGATTTIQLVIPTAPAPGTYRARIAIEETQERIETPDFTWAAPNR